VTRSISGVILDVDGTLIDSNAAHAHAWVDTLSEHGYDCDVGRVQQLIGLGSDKLLPALIGVDKDSQLGEKLTRRRKAIFRARYLPWLQPTRGAQALLDRFEREQFGLMLASSSDGEELSSLLLVCGAPELARRTPPPHVVGGSKPDPDVVVAALARLYRSPDEVLMLGDTPYDVEAAQRAGIRIIALRCGGWSTRDLEGALAIYDDPADLLSRTGDGPLFREFSRP
jgi:HAD superfamily hydrolase (TIGR01509 family)